ncbi:FAD-dependent oxidoreductase [Quadrisphaera sp. DSM 44207]|uniref:FAD-dependent oxidoreductase n=1 Tax=Quadrisphaera sp. DSM 44207 TaxID=1881057 RepID=UPI000886620C|nr:FAD-dependent oxidoreductase [Quadrisphaera sp. DSM 44207]SDQ65532.1 Dehydrogenase (flavoprotein) [Quadrisphaera sp. DSM 44207]
MAQQQAVVVGSGPGGTTAALGLARQGWSVTVVERDASGPPQGGDVEAWERSGVAQFHHPHAFLARLFAELQRELPDVLDALSAAGAVPVPLPGPVRAAWCRRSTLERVLREVLAAEPRVGRVAGSAAAVVRSGGRVTGLRLRTGDVLPARLVVDAGGRRGRLTEDLVGDEVDEPSNEVYASRRYRLRPGACAPRANRRIIAVAESDGYAVLVFPHDAGTFTAALARLPEDDELAQARHGEVFDAALAAVPMALEWIAPQQAEPISAVRVMGGLRNTHRVLREDAPLGLHRVGDVVCTTNPHFGRGTALAVASALRLASAVAADPGDARSWREATDAWERGELREWFEDGCELDRSRTAVWRAGIAGRPAGPALLASVPPGQLPRLAVLAAAGADPVIARTVLRHMHMVDAPQALLTAAPRVQDLLARGWRPGADAEGAPAPARADLVERLRRHARGAASSSGAGVSTTATPSTSSS